MKKYFILAIVFFLGGILGAVGMHISPKRTALLWEATLPTTSMLNLHTTAALDESDKLKAEVQEAICFQLDRISYMVSDPDDLREDGYVYDSLNTIVGYFLHPNEQLRLRECESMERIKKLIQQLEFNKPIHVINK